MFLTIIETDEAVCPYLKEIRPKYATACSNNKTFEMVVQNSGIEDITTIKYEVSLDNRNPEEDVWTGVIPSNSVQIIDFDVKVPSGEHVVGVKMKEVNGFKLIDEIHIKDDITLKSKQEIYDLFTMTPYYYKTSKQSIEKLLQLDSLKTRVSFVLLVYQKVEN